MYTKFINLFFIFIIYSFIGYVTEVIYCSISEKKIVNRGFLFGPICPIYGFGATFILLLLKRYYDDPIVVFVFCMLICSTIEYITSYVFEKVYHNKWWDYSNYKYNINGRICLLNSVLFGLGGCAIMYFINPFVESFIGLFQSKTIIIWCTIFLVVFIIDCIYSSIIAFNLRNRIIIAEELKKEKVSMLPGYISKAIKKKAASLKAYPTRLLKAFPTLQKNYKDIFDIMRVERAKAKQNKKNK